MEKDLYKRILITRTDRIGDVLLSTPVIEAVRRACPDAYISFMTRPCTKDIVDGNPYLNEIILYDKEGRHRSVLATMLFALSLRKKRFDLALVLHSAVRINWVVFLAGIPKRIGYARKAGCLLTGKLPYVKKEGLKHEMEYTLDVARAAGLSFDRSGLKPFMPVNKEAEVNIENFLKENGVEKKAGIFAVHPSASCPSRVWPVERFARVADLITQETGYKAVILGAGSDYKAAQSVREKMSQAAFILKDPALKETAAFLKICKFIISTDTGPSHIASAMGTPCVVIFGRKQPGISPTRWKPQGEKVIVLHKDAGCVDCLAHNCENDFACIKATTTDEVLDAARKFF